jgi:Seryl-tRNA synthetase
MIDPKIVKDNPNLLQDMLKKRKVDFPFSELLDMDRKRRELIIETQNFRHRKNTLSQSIANKKKNQESIDRELDEMKKVRRANGQFGKQEGCGRKEIFRFNLFYSQFITGVSANW